MGWKGIFSKRPLTMPADHLNAEHGLPILSKLSRVNTTVQIQKKFDACQKLL